MGQWIKNLPAVKETQETRFRFLGQEDPLEEGMATHFSILAWRIPWTVEPEGLQFIALQSQIGLKRLRQARSDRLVQTDVGWHRRGSWAAVTGLLQLPYSSRVNWGH